MVVIDQCLGGVGGCSDDWSVVRVALADRELSQVAQKRRTECKTVAAGEWRGVCQAIVCGEHGVRECVAVAATGEPGGQPVAAVVGAVERSVDETQGGIDGNGVAGGFGEVVGMGGRAERV